MTIDDSEADDLFRDNPADMAHESRQSGRMPSGGHDRPSNRTRHGGFTPLLRIKPDRRCLVTHVDPASERRRR